MPERTLEAFEFKGPKPQTIGILVILLIVFILKCIEKKGWTLVIATALLTAIVSYLLFGIWLQATLPKGIFGI